MIRKLAFGFAMLFVVVVVLGWIPQLITSTHMTPTGSERMVMGLYMMSLLDDITHGVTAIALIVAALHSRKASLIAFTAFGWYYACDAVFYLLNGFMTRQALSANIGLNLPHVLISIVMLGIVYWLAPRETRVGIHVPAAAAA